MKLHNYSRTGLKNIRKKGAARWEESEWESGSGMKGLVGSDGDDGPGSGEHGKQLLTNVQSRSTTDDMYL